MVNKKIVGLFSILFIVISISSIYAFDYLGTPFGPPYDVFDNNNKVIFSINQTSFNLANPSDPIAININVTNQGGFVYKTGYYLDVSQQRWIAFDFSEKTLGNTSWIINRAYKTITIPGNRLSNGQGNAIIIYSCKKYEGVWKCGCDSKTGQCDQWQLLTFDVSGATTYPTCDDDADCNSGKRCIGGLCVSPSGGSGSGSGPSSGCSEGSSQACITGPSSCDGIQTCSSGTWGECIKTNPNCGSGITCTNGANKACTIGACAGTQTCSLGKWSSCVRTNPSCTGSGTVADPYLITTIQQIQNISNDLTSNYILANDIDASETKNWNSGAGFIPLGDCSIIESPATFLNPAARPSLTGTFDGNGHTISNLYINRTGYVGLFGCTNYSSIIKNVGLVNVNISGGIYTGGIAGVSKGLIEKSYVQGNINCINGRCGGIAGTSAGNIKNSYSATDIICSGNCIIGGLVGETNLQSVLDQFSLIYGNITDCYSLGTLKPTVGFTGGFIGVHRGGSIFKSFSNILLPYAGSLNTGDFVAPPFVGEQTNARILNVTWNRHSSSPNPENIVCDEAYPEDYIPGYFECTRVFDNEAYFKNQANEPMKFWDFTNTWAIDPAKNNGYPYLKWQNL